MSDLRGYDAWKERLPEDERECDGCEKLDEAVEQVGRLQDALEAATDARDTAYAALRVCAALLLSRFTEAERREALSCIAKALPDEDES